MIHAEINENLSTQPRVANRLIQLSLAITAQQKRLISLFSLVSNKIRVVVEMTSGRENINAQDRINKEHALECYW